MPREVLSILSSQIVADDTREVDDTLARRDLNLIGSAKIRMLSDCRPHCGRYLGVRCACAHCGSTVIRAAGDEYTDKQNRFRRREYS